MELGRDILQIWIIEKEGPTVLSVCVGGVIWTFFSPILFSHSERRTDGD